MVAALRDDEREIPLAEQEAAMPGAPGYARAMLVVAVIIFTIVVLFALVWLLMAAINPMQPRDGKSRVRPTVEQPYPPAQPAAAPEAPIRGLPPPPAPSK